MSPRSRNTLSVLIAVLFGLVAPAAGTAAAKTKPPCVKHPGELYADPSGSIRIWHDRDSLTACSQVSARWSAKRKQWIKKFGTRHLGPWSTGARLVSGGQRTAVWTVPVRNRRGALTGAERIWGRSLAGGPVLLAGIKAQISRGNPYDGPINAIKVSDPIVAWTSGDSAFTVGTTAQRVIDTVDKSFFFGDETKYLSTMLDPGQVVHLGTWPGTSSPLAATLTIGQGDGEGDDCEHIDWAPVTVTPDTTPYGVTLLRSSVNELCD